MSIESEIFAKYEADPAALEGYGFVREGDALVYRYPLPEDGFEIVLRWDGGLRGRIDDLDSGGEYVNFRNENSTGYSAEIRSKFCRLLEDIRKKCCVDMHFRSDQARRVCRYIRQKYGCMPEFLWKNFPDYAAFRRDDSGKWFAVIGTVARCKIDRASDDKSGAEWLNVKVAPADLDGALAVKGFYPAYHMNKKSWITVILDGTVGDREIERRLDDSFSLVKRDA